ncbi:MAG: hypothetical protein ACLRI8_08360 [Agathobacter rectalis]
MESQGGKVTGSVSKRQTIW